MREVVQRTHDPNLLTITAGRTPANPSELLASDRMRALLSGLETGPFDWIIIDTPPVLAVTDAVILAPLVGAVTFVIGAEMTRWRLAERAVETLLGSNPRQRARGAQQGELRAQQVLLLALLRAPVQELLRGITGGLICAACAADPPRRRFLPAVRGRQAVDPGAAAGARRRRRAVGAASAPSPFAGTSRPLDLALVALLVGDRHSDRSRCRPRSWRAVAARDRDRRRGAVRRRSAPAAASWMTLSVNPDADARSRSAPWRSASSASGSRARCSAPAAARGCSAARWRSSARWPPP